MIQDLVVALVFIGYAIGVLMTFGTVLTWVERKQAAIMSDRIGANRAYVRIPFTQVKLVWWGLFHGMADGLKMMLKEDFKPDTYDRFAYALAPWVVFTPVLLVFAVDPVRRHARSRRRCSRRARVADWFGDRTYPLQIARLDAGLLVVFAFGGIDDHRRDARRLVVGEQVLAARRAARRLADDLLRAGHGPHRARADPHLRHASTSATIVRQQSGTLLGFLPAWGIVYQPFAAILFLTAAIAENKRIPFDLPEAESELIAGYFTEYSAMKMGLFMFAEFIEIAIIGALFTTLFLGGYNLPFMTDAGFVLPGGQHDRAAAMARSS